MAANETELKYDGFPFISNIDKYVQDELSNRALYRLREQNTPYVKITPGFSTDGTAAGKIILKGIESPDGVNPSTYKFKDLYRPDSSFRPLAGVKSLTVGYLNAFGSIKKATFTWVCHTLEDLERLSPFFLTPGVTIFIEYGWSDFVSQAIANNLDNTKINLATYLPYVRRLKQITHGNYDGMLGIILNYSFVLNRDGGFDCTTEVVSAGYVMEGITIPNQSTVDTNNKVKTSANVQLSADEKKKQEDEKAKADKDAASGALKTLELFLENDFAAQLSEHYKLKKFTSTECDNNTHDYFIYSTNRDAGIKSLVDSNTGKSSNRNLQSSVKVGSTTTLTELDIPERTSVYATWGYLEDYVINSHIEVAVNGSDDLLFGFDSRGVKIASHEALRTTDLGVCIIPIPNKGDAGTGNATPLPDFKSGDSGTATGLDYGYIRRILVNVQFFKEVFSSATTINDGVMQVFSGINNVCINYWNFRLVPIEDRYDETTGKKDTSGNVNAPGLEQTPAMTNFKNIGSTTKNQYIINPSSGLGITRKNAILAEKVVDINYTDSIFSNMKAGLYVMRTKSFKVNDVDTTSVIRNLTFQSKLSSQAAMNVFFAAQNKEGRVMGSPSNNTFQSLYDFPINNSKYANAIDTFSMSPYKAQADSNPENNLPNQSNVTDPATETDPFIRAMTPYGDGLMHYLPAVEKGYWFQTIKNEKEIQLSGKEGMKIAVLCALDKSAPPAISEALVPLECEVELEGISGIRIGDIFTIDHIPKIYQNHGTFQVIGITDTVDKNSWITKLKCGFRVFRNVDYDVVKGRKVKVTTANRTGVYPHYSDKSFVNEKEKARIINRIREIWMDKSIEGFAVSEHILNDAINVVNGESGFRAQAANTSPPDDSYGLFQVNMIKGPKWNLYSERTKWTDLGIVKDKKSVNASNKKTYTDHNLWDIDTNIKVAKRIFKLSNYRWYPTWGAAVALDSSRIAGSLKSEITV